MSTLKIKVIVSSTRANRFSEKPAQWIYAEARKRTGLEVELLDLRDYPLPFFEEAMPPGMAKDGYTNPAVVRWRDKIRESDGFIICTPEYNHGYPAVLKNALDYVYFAWARKAVSFVSWGGAGGTGFWVDPKEQLVAVLMTQAQPGPWQREFKELFRQMVYQAIVD